MPGKCDFCGEKVKNGVCTGCGMDYNRSSADTAYERSEEKRKPSDDAEMFSKAMLKGTKTYQHRKKTITTVFFSKNTNDPCRRRCLGRCLRGGCFCYIMKLCRIMIENEVGLKK